MINGNAGKVQFGIEATYGGSATLSKQIGVKSEGFKYVPNKKEEGLLTGGKTGGKTYTMSKGAEGTISTVVRPDELGYWFGLAFGKEDQTPNKIALSTAVYEHVFTPCDSDETPPSALFSIDRVVKVYDYPGSKVNTLSFSTAAEDFLNLEIGLMCKTEEEGSALTPISLSPLKPFRFYHGVVKVEGTEVADITSVKFDWNNNMEKVFTTQSGQYPIEFGVGMRELKIDLELLYNSDNDELRSDYFITDDDLSIDLEFTSDEEAETGFPYYFKISVPAAQVTDMGPANLSGETLKQNMSVKAVQGSSEFCTATLHTLLDTAYIPT